jgi:intein-encoded DNA endonuclease-like protein
MKKKIINGLLFAAALVVASSSFVSCKDYEGDDYARLQTASDYADAVLESQLQAQLTAMQAALNQCGTDCAAARTALENSLKTWVQSQGFITSHQDLSAYDTRATYQAWVQSQGYLTEHQDLSGYDNRATYQQWVLDQINANNQTMITAVNSMLTNNTETQNAVNTIIEKYLQDHGITTGGMTQAEVQTLINSSLAGYLTETAADAKYLQQSALNDYYTKAQIDAMAALWNATIMSDSLKKAYEWADYSYKRLVAQGDSIKNVYDWMQSTNPRLDSIKTAYENAAYAKEIADKAWNYVKETKDKNGNEFANLQELYNALNSADEALAQDIEKLNGRLAKTEKAIADLYSALKSQITSININGAYNPVFGYLAAPFDVQSNVLAANYGVASRNTSFPTADNAAYFTNQSIISQDEFNLVKANGGMPAEVDYFNKFPAGEVIIDQSEGNAGTLYVTVNPSNVDFTGTTFSLRSTSNMESKVFLGDLTPSTEELPFGYKRASANGFYEAKATVYFDDAKSVSPNYDLKNIANKLRDAITIDRANRKVDIKFGEIAKTIYSNIQNILPRLAVQANWRDTTGYKSVASEYSVAATAVKALSFDLAYGMNRQWISHVPGRFVRAIDREINSLLKVELEIDPLNLSEIYVVEPNQKFIVYVMNQDGSYYIDPVTNQKVMVDVTDYIMEIYGNLNTALQKYNDKVPDLNNLPDKINEAISKALNKKGTELKDFVDRYVSRINTYIDKANKLINNANYYLQPVLLSTATDGSYVQLSRIQTVPSKVNDGDIIALIPTTFTAELIVPAYAKHLCVTNVFDANGNAASDGDATCKAKMAQANSATSINSQRIMQGKAYAAFNAAGLGGDYTYEIAYTAMDYTGKVSGKKYYINVK